ncbi:MAG: Npt1/Npt2 family nucleotide transporter [Alphaproteobacteria bacterium]|nr:Npt1/Npt2 family nucleotide transporter [Alphaproteobacteria bacterium]
MTADKSNIKNESFLSKVRAVIWPVYGNENLKFIPMALMMALILFNYTILRGTKDALVISGEGSGSEVTSFLKVWGVLPFAIMFFFFYSKMSNLLSRPALFYTVIMIFVVFFAAFTIFLYPNRDALHMGPEKLFAMQAEYPFAKWLIPMLANWTDSLFYIMAELWGSVVLSLLFWQLANLSTRVNEAKRFYGFFGLIGNMGVMLSGFATKYFDTLGKEATLASGNTIDGYGTTIGWICGSVAISAVIIMALFFFVNNKVIANPKYAPQEGEAPKKKSKPKLSLGDSFKQIFTSKYLAYIALLVVIYGITMNLIEQTWKSQMKIAFPSRAEYNAAMGDVFIWISVLTMIFMLLGSNLLRIFGWLTSALITPIVILITGGVFFAMILFPDTFRPYMMEMGISLTAVQVACMFGQWQQVLAKSTKYSLFDPTKEMAYIPLDDDMKIKGKAAVDVVGGRLGKSGGALLQQILLVVTAGTQITIAPYLAGLVIVGLGIWFWAVFGLNKLFVAKNKEPSGGQKDKEAANIEKPSVERKSA